MLRFADNNPKSSFVAGSARRRWAGRSDKSFAGATTQSAEFCSYDAVMQWFEPSDNLFPEMTQRKRSRLGPGTSTKRGGKAFEVITHELLKNCKNCIHDKRSLNSFCWLHIRIWLCGYKLENSGQIFAKIPLVYVTSLVKLLLDMRIERTWVDHVKCS